MDWFRLAQNWGEWRKLILQAFPPEVVIVERERDLDRWHLGLPIRQWALPTDPPIPDREHDCSEDELGIRLKGHAPGQETQTYKMQNRRPHTNRRAIRGQRTPTCPVCQQQFSKFNSLTFHYEATHAICDPALTIVQSLTCPKCKQTFRRAGQCKVQPHAS